MSQDADKEQDQQPDTAADSLQPGQVSGGVVAMGRGAMATAVYQGLTTAEVAALVVQLKRKDQPKVMISNHQSSITPYALLRVPLSSKDEKDTAS